MRFGHVSIGGLAGLAAALGAVSALGAESQLVNEMRPKAKRFKKHKQGPRADRKTKQFKLKGIRP